MAVAATPAVVLRLTPFSETSKVVRLLTPEYGLVGALARGARRPRSRTGAGLDLFVLGQASVRFKPHGDLHDLTAFDLVRGHPRLAEDVTRFAAASALAEIALRCVPAEPQAAAFDALETGLDALERASPDATDSAGLSACWRLVVALGFEPVLDRCLVCGTQVGGAASFSAAQGGVVCARHRSDAGRLSRLAAADRAALDSLLRGRWPDPPLDHRHAAAHRRLLIAFVRHHLAEDRALPALAFWDRESWNATS